MSGEISRARAELAEEIERLCNDLDRAADEGRDCSDQNYAIAWCVAEQHRDTILAGLRGPSADDAYAERNKLVAALARLYPSGTKRTAIEGWDPEWEGCVYIDLPTGQASWHYHNREAELFADLPPYAGEWDGHSTEEKYRRLSALRESDVPETWGGLSWSGHNIRGDRASIEAVQHALHEAGAIPAFRAAVIEARNALKAEREPDEAAVERAAEAIASARGCDNDPPAVCEAFGGDCECIRDARAALRAAREG